VELKGALKRRSLSWCAEPLSGSNLHITVGAALVLVGLVLRMWSITQARWSGEESWFWSIGRDIAEGRSFPVLGHPISGTRALHPGSAFYVFIAATQLFGPSPLAASAAVSLLGLGTLVALALVVGRGFGRHAGLAFLALGAVSPWWIVYTNAAWPGYLFPGLCALLLVLLGSIVERPETPSAVAQGATLLLLVLSFQIHLSLVHFWTIALVVVVIWRPAPARRALALALALGCLAYVPYLVHEVRSGFTNTLAIAHRSQGEGRSLSALGVLLGYFMGFATTDLSYLYNQGYWHRFDPVRFWRTTGVADSAQIFARTGWAPLSFAALGASWLVALVSATFFVREAGLRLRASLRVPGNFLVVAFLAAVGGIPVFYLLSGKGGYPHYVSVVQPLAYLPAAVLLGRLLGHRIGRWVAAGYLVLFAAGGVLGLRAYYAVDSRWSVPATTAAVRFILERTRSAGTPPADAAQRPFALRFTFGPTFPAAYELVARRVLGRPFPVDQSAPDRFRIDARLPGDPPPPGPAENRIVLPSLVVTHERSPPGVPSM
jgi:hypothetical protein